MWFEKCDLRSMFKCWCKGLNILGVSGIFDSLEIVKNGMWVRFNYKYKKVVCFGERRMFFVL